MGPRDLARRVSQAGMADVPSAGALRRTERRRKASEPRLAAAYPIPVLDRLPLTGLGQRANGESANESLTTLATGLAVVFLPFIVEASMRPQDLAVRSSPVPGANGRLPAAAPSFCRPLGRSVCSILPIRPPCRTERRRVSGTLALGPPLGCDFVENGMRLRGLRRWTSGRRGESETEVRFPRVAPGAGHHQMPDGLLTSERNLSIFDV